MTRYDKRHARDKPRDNREGAERDVDRILYTSALRRLAGITQVVAAQEGHVFHNRLTHTMKVAQVGRRIAQMLSRGYGETKDPAPPPLDPDVVEAAALAHDLGHPPYGHIAEQELHALVTDAEPNDGFEGNAQSFRIVTRLARCDIAFPGLNLTRATLNAVLKYPRFHEPADEDAPAYRKWGAYRYEVEDLCFARTVDEPSGEVPVHVDDGRQSLEASVMDWADDIAYAVHDVEDMYRAGLVPLDRLATRARDREHVAEWVRERWQAQHRPLPGDEALVGAFEIIPVNFGTDQPYDGTDRQRAALRNFTSTLIGRYVKATDLSVDSGGDWVLDVPLWARLEVAVLKELTWRYVIERPALASQQHGQRRIVRDLFQTFQEAADGRASRALLPERVRTHLARAHQANADTRGLRARVVCDAICSLTEDEAVRLHRRLTGTELGSVADIVI